MKTRNFYGSLAAIAAVLFLAGNLLAQNSPANAGTALAYGVPQVLQLAQAKVSDDTIIAYIRNSGNSYGLDANQIIYLRQQGISDHVLNAMLSQPKVAAAPAQPASHPEDSTAQSTATYTQPATSYVQSIPSSTVYVMPDTQTYYYNAYYARPYYSYYPYSYYYVNPFPVVRFSFGFGGGFHGGFRSGFHGGWHR